MNYHALLDYVVFVASNEPSENDAVFGTVVSAGPEALGLQPDDKIVVDNKNRSARKVENAGYVVWVCSKYDVMFTRTSA